MLPRMARRWVWVAGLLTSLAGCAQEEVPLRFRTAPVERRDLTATVEASARIAARNLSAVLPGVEGRLRKVLVRPGQRVEAGAALGEIDGAPLRHELAAARAGAAAAAAASEQARIASKAADEELKRGRRLASRGQLSEAKQAALEASAESSKAALRVANANLQKARASVERAEWAVEQTHLRAGEAGVVLTVPPRVGDIVSPRGPALFTLAAPLDVVRVEAAVSEAEVGRVRVGQTSSLEVAAFPDLRFPARIEQVGVSATAEDGLPMYPVVLVAENAEQKLLPGMGATVRFETGTVKDALVVQEAALRYVPPGAESAPPRSRVFVLDGDGLRAVAVTAGLSEDGRVEVQPLQGGLAVGAQVVVGLGEGAGAASGPGISLGGGK